MIIGAVHWKHNNIATLSIAFQRTTASASTTLKITDDKRNMSLCHKTKSLQFMPTLAFFFVLEKFLSCNYCFDILCRSGEIAY